MPHDERLVLLHGRFLLAIVGDKVWPSTVEITEQLNRYPGLGLQFVTIELETFVAGDEDNLLVVPRITRQTEIIERSVIEVRVDQHKPPEVTITQDKAPKKTRKTTHKALSEAAFWDMLKENAPEHYNGIRELVQTYRDNENVDMTPGSNGLVFKKILSESNRTISLFFITTDGSVRVLAQAPKQQFNSLGFDLDGVATYESEMKKILQGFSCKYGAFDLGEFKSAVARFMDAIDEADQESA